MTAHSSRALTFTTTPEKGAVSALLDRPDGARTLFVLGHGSGTNMRHPLIAGLSDALVRARMATFRFQYPYSEKGGGGLDGRAVLLETIRSAIATAIREAPDLSVFAGGHSMSGRMTTLAAAEAPLTGVNGVICVSFPLNGGKGPAERAAHLPRLTVPLLFLQGTRDPLADINDMRDVTGRLGTRATLHEVETADHGFKVLKRLGQTHEQVIEALAGVIATWTEAQR